MSEFIELHLTGMAHGGSAIGRYEGRAIFVPYGIPGEHIRARILQDKGRFAIAEVVEVLDASASRMTPRCAHFFRCGGCQWQHIAYSAQLEFKQRIVQEQLARIGGFHEAPVQPTIPSDPEWQYRSHSTFHVTNDHHLGFIGTDNQSVVTIDECHIARPELAQFLGEIVDGESPGSYLRLQVGSEGEVISFPMASDDYPADLSPREGVHYEVKGRQFQCSAGSFFQVNLPQAAILVDKVLEYLNPSGEQKLLELYSGVGLFTSFLAECVKDVVAIEVSASAVRDAEVNLAEFDNVTLVEGKVERVLSDFGKLDFDAAVLDPPRAGMNPAALKALLGYAPRRIVYVSCDPATLARDAKRFGEAGYHIENVQPVDMFPQTYHIECVVSFSRSEARPGKRKRR